MSRSTSWFTQPVPSRLVSSRALVSRRSYSPVRHLRMPFVEGIMFSSGRAFPERAAHLLRALAPLAPLLLATAPAPKERHLLYVASPGTRNYTEYGGVGLLVFDIDDGYRFVRRIPTWTTPEGKSPENVKGIAASARTGRVFVTSLTRVIAIDAVSGAKIW